MFDRQVFHNSQAHKFDINKKLMDLSRREKKGRSLVYICRSVLARYTTSKFHIYVVYYDFYFCLILVDPMMHPRGSRRDVDDK